MVVQYRIPKHLTLADLWQRLGRCARQASIAGLGLTFVDDKYLLPSTFNSDPEAQRLAQFVQGVTPEHRDTISDFVHSMYTGSRADSSGQSVFSKIDPAMLWVVNTHGCRMRAILAAFDDPETYTEICSNCQCDNCFFPPRNRNNRRLPPPELLVPQDINLRARQRASYMKNQQAEQTAVIAKRMGEVDTFRGRARDTHSGRQCGLYGFCIKKTLRYEDTAAYEQDLIDGQLAVLSNTNRNFAKEKPSGDFVDTVISRLIAFRDEVYSASGYAHIGITASMFFSDKLIAHIGAQGNNISTVDDLCQSVDKKFHFKFFDSLVGKYYAAQILDIIVACNSLYPSNSNLRTLDQPMSDLREQPMPVANSNLPESAVLNQPLSQNSNLNLNPPSRVQLKAPHRKRRRKYELESEPEDSFDLNDPTAAERLEIQRQLQQRDRQIAQDRQARLEERQRAKAEQIVKSQAVQSERRKQKATAPKKTKECS